MNMKFHYNSLSSYRKEIDRLISEGISELGEKSKLRDACEYALLNGGKRFRPSIVFMVAKALNSDCDVRNAALSVEFFHTASLIADDLPCMDNDNTRRGKPSLHKEYGETTAILASYALIAAGYRNLYKSTQACEKFFSRKCGDLCMLALDNVTSNTGINGAVGGQFLDIYPPDQKLDTLRRVTHTKTVTLYEMAFVLGWIFGGGSLNKLDLVKKGSWCFGMAFQIADDFGDAIEDRERGCETNFVVALGEKKAKEVFQGEISGFREALKDLSLETTDFWELALFLEKKVEEVENTL